MTWLADAGHACHVLTTARLAASTGSRSKSTWRVWGERAGRRLGDTRRPVVRYHAGGVPVTLLLTRHNDETAPDPGESQQYLELVADLLDGFAPDQVIACNAHPMIQVALEGARARGLTTAFALRSYGYGRRYFDHADHVFTCSAFLTASYHSTIGLVSTPLEPPIDWDTVMAPAESRAFVTFVHPAPHKGLFLFARLADMLGARRPDIPSSSCSRGRAPAHCTRFRVSTCAATRRSWPRRPCPRRRTTWP